MKEKVIKEETINEYKGLLRLLITEALLILFILIPLSYKNGRSRPSERDRPDGRLKYLYSPAVNRLNSVSRISRDGI